MRCGEAGSNCFWSLCLIGVAEVGVGFGAVFLIRCLWTFVLFLFLVIMRYSLARVVVSS